MSIILLYLITAACFVANLIFAKEWTEPALSKGFMISVIMLPVVAISMAFAVQIIALLFESWSRGAKMDHMSRFMFVLEQSQAKSLITRHFFKYILDEWSAAMQRLGDGVITVQKDYWTVCAQLYDLAEDVVECTSVVPIGFWDDISPVATRPAGSAEPNRELLRYKDRQKEILIGRRGVTVRRTFILKGEDLSTDEQIRQFLDVVCRQLTEEFRIYFVWLENHHDPVLRDTLVQDFSLIDHSVLMLGGAWDLNQAAYLYTFFDLSFAKTNPPLFNTALTIFDNADNVIAGRGFELKIEKIRSPIYRLALLDDPKYHAYKTAIETHCKSLRMF